MISATKVGTSIYGKKIIDTTKKQGSKFAKTAGKKNSSKNCRSNRRFDWKKVADKSTSLGKPKNKEKETN